MGHITVDSRQEVLDIAKRALEAAATRQDRPDFMVTSRGSLLVARACLDRLLNGAELARGDSR